jgi:hypothetical protein
LCCPNTLFLLKIVALWVLWEQRKSEINI